MQICAARFEADKPGRNVGSCSSRWQLEITCGSSVGINASVFLEFDSINYLRHALWYPEWIKALESENPY